MLVSYRAVLPPDRTLGSRPQGNIAIFMDMYPQMLAYQAGGLANIQAMHAQNLIKDEQLQAWNKIDTGIKSGNSASIWSGNDAILHVEQTQTIQPVFDKELGLWKTLTGLYGYPVIGNNFAIKSPVPGDTSNFQDLYPDRSFADGWAKYGWTVYTMVPVWKNWRKTNPNIVITTLFEGGYSN